MAHTHTIHVNHMTCSLHWWRGTGSGGWPVSLGASGNEKHDGWLSFHRYHRDEDSYWDIWLAIWYIYIFIYLFISFLIYIPIYTYTYIHIHIHIYIYTCIYICMRVYIYIYLWAFVWCFLWWLHGFMLPFIYWLPLLP